MEWLVRIGALVTLAGVAGLGYCVWTVLRTRRSGLPDDEMRVALQRIVTINMTALGVSAFGLICVVAGIALD